MEIAFASLKTNPELIEKINNAAAHKPSARELFEQRVSYVLGVMPHNSTVTREQVEKVMLDQDGSEPK